MKIRIEADNGTGNLRCIRPLRGLSLLALIALAGCGLPRGGPSEAELTAQGDADTLPFEVVRVTDTVAKIARIDEARAYSEAFLRSAPENVDDIATGDKLTVTVWENVGGGEGVLTGVGQKFAILQETEVDEDGFIFMPYVGRVRAEGNTIEGLRRVIANGLSDQTPDPQVEVRRIEQGGAKISVIGNVRAPGIYVIENATRRILPMLSAAGGVVEEPEVALITLRRGRLTATVWLEELYDRPDFNVALRAGDQIIVERDRRAFTALGALNSQVRVPFPSRNINALEALGLVGGINSQLGDPSGIFVFRTETAQIADSLLTDRQVLVPTRMVYTIDLAQPGGMLTASNFEIRDGDIVYATEAPAVQFIKALSSVAPVVNFASSANNLAN
ncbi:MAG: polysaccharide biosynthesis/export family protein [Pseudomonadota bacterium]